MTSDPAGSGFPGEWYAAFYDGECRHWWWPLCRAGFRHVVVFGFCVQVGAWLIYDVTLGRTYVCAVKPEVFDLWLASLPRNRRIVAFPSPAHDAPSRPLRLGFWCTPAAAHLLGIDSRALRPQALYRDLVAQGARTAFESDPA